MEPNLNCPRSSLLTRISGDSRLGLVDYEKTLDEYWQSICPGHEEDSSKKAKKNKNPEEQKWRYLVIRKTDKSKGKAKVIPRCASQIKKEAILGEEDDKEVNLEKENMELAADHIVICSNSKIAETGGGSK